MSETKDCVETKDTRVPKKTAITIGDDVLIKVKSGFHGKLYYKNLVTGEMTVWDRQGDVQIMSMRDLRAMKARQVAFFKNQWIIILGVAEGESCKATPADICRSLVVTQYYENFVDPTRFDAVIAWSEAEIAEKVPLMSDGAKENLVVALNKFIATGRLDSMRKKRAFEKALDCELREFK